MHKLLFPCINIDGVKGVLIDIDNTLYPYNPAHDKAIAVCYDAFIKDISPKYSFEEFNKRYREKRRITTNRLEPGGSCRSRLFAFKALFEEIGIKQAYNKALLYEAVYWDSLIDNIEPNQDALAFLKKCKESKLKVCAISDMQEHFQIRKLQKLGFDYFIDYLVTSEEAGIEKPSPTIFELALKKLALGAKDVIMVGDAIDKDINGAKALGIKTFKVDII